MKPSMKPSIRMSIQRKVTNRIKNWIGLLVIGGILLVTATLYDSWCAMWYTFGEQLFKF